MRGWRFRRLNETLDNGEGVEPTPGTGGWNEGGYEKTVCDRADVRVVDSCRRMVMIEEKWAGDCTW